MHQSQRIKTQENKTIFIRQLNHTSTRKSLTSYFSKFGKVASAKITKKKSDARKNTALLTFVASNALHRALKAKHTIEQESGFKIEKFLRGKNLN
jgi:RNA recognition motif-containing protein